MVFSPVFQPGKFTPAFEIRPIQEFSEFIDEDEVFDFTDLPEEPSFPGAVLGYTPGSDNCFDDFDNLEGDDTVELATSNVTFLDQMQARTEIRYATVISCLCYIDKKHLAGIPMQQHDVATRLRRHHCETCEFCMWAKTAPPGRFVYNVFGRRGMTRIPRLETRHSVSPDGFIALDICPPRSRWIRHLLAKVEVPFDHRHPALCSMTKYKEKSVLPIADTGQQQDESSLFLSDELGELQTSLGLN